MFKSIKSFLLKLIFGSLLLVFMNGGTSCNSRSSPTEPERDPYDFMFSGEAYNATGRRDLFESAFNHLYDPNKENEIRKYGGGIFSIGQYFRIERKKDLTIPFIGEKRI